MKKIITTLSFIIVLLFATMLAGCQFAEPSEDDTFTKSINTCDLELEYTVYEGSYIKVYVTPLVDIKDLHVQVCFYQWKNFLNQESQWINEKFIQKGKKYLLSHSISDDEPYDRVSLLSISGKKDQDSIDLTEKKRIGTIMSKRENISTDLFTLRFDNSFNYGNSTDNNRFFGRLYITSSINLWDVKFSLQYDFENSHSSGGRYSPDFEKIAANEEIYVDMYKPISAEEDIKIKNIKIESATSRELKATIVDEELQIITSTN